MTVTIYGIRNCDTMKKARAWLVEHGVAHRFHDYRVDGLDRAMLERWAAGVGWETLLNRSGTTFRKLAEADRANLDSARAIDLMLAQPAMVKRPVLEIDGNVAQVGFRPARYAELLSPAG